ncbi:MAG: hypothetical protein SP1CHLAM54_00540 [Chlamydiia bacterium]|nr:hypothetical protein [Chlamydiia bacterium]MCH9614976.1 hypothetical protein [Chlamydiia bacterium]MCH9629974.1 hypothetical protein [Chlamydiia bacterium]
MQFAITKDHMNYFREHGYVSFEDLLKEDELAEILHHYQRGARDAWRHNEKLKKIVCKRSFSNLAKEIFQVDTLRLAYTEYTDHVTPLDETSSVQYLTGALILGENPTMINTETDFECGPSLVIAFCSSVAVYVKNDADPHTHDLKKMGLVFGDRLQNDTHPLLH